MTQFPFPTDPDDSGWPHPPWWPHVPWHPVWTGRRSRAQSTPGFDDSFLVEIGDGSTEYCFNPATGQSFYVDKKPTVPVRFRRFATRADDEVEAGLASIRFDTDDGIRGSITAVARVRPGAAPRRPREGSIAIGVDAMGVHLFSAHLDGDAPGFRWALPPARHSALGRPSVEVLGATAAAINQALADTDFAIKPPAAAGASGCDVGCGTAGSALAAVASWAFAGMCTGASAGVAAPACVPVGVGLGGALGGLGGGVCSWAFC